MLHKNHTLIPPRRTQTTYLQSPKLLWHTTKAGGELGRLRLLLLLLLPAMASPRLHRRSISSSSGSSQHRSTDGVLDQQGGGHTEEVGMQVRRPVHVCVCACVHVCMCACVCLQSSQFCTAALTVCLISRVEATRRRWACKSGDLCMYVVCTCLLCMYKYVSIYACLFTHVFSHVNSRMFIYACLPHAPHLPSHMQLR
jgi:hypothetical protein